VRKIIWMGMMLVKMWRMMLEGEKKNTQAANTNYYVPFEGKDGKYNVVGEVGYYYKVGSGQRWPVLQLCGR
jgi:hypothetical protein